MRLTKEHQFCYTIYVGRLDSRLFFGENAKISENNAPPQKNILAFPEMYGTIFEDKCIP
jgi:hypothetical protein